MDQLIRQRSQNLNYLSFYNGMILQTYIIYIDYACTNFDINLKNVARHKTMVIVVCNYLHNDGVN